MQVKESKSLGIRKKLFIINSVLLVAALFASGFAISEFSNLGNQISNGNIEQQGINQTIQNVIIIQIGLASIAAGVNGYSFIFARTLTKPIVDAANIAKKISEGDLTVDFEKSKSNDELGDLTNSLALMQENLRQLVFDVHETATKVAQDS
ncbi:MAG: HAMP domain-containing protein, partial [Nitrosopumilaceae archaeon]|nr:HAMP domain-containing protein [Nitrosopumilaceae archaeon]